ncbi:MAG: hypothetical protein IKM94_02750 [Alphaproteobacteria bacterium]|nr:hypothetical protein [Alphaproteobacteria bacterium]
MKTKLFLRFGLLIAICTVAMPGYCATQSSGKQSAIQQGTKVRAKTTAAGLYNQECYDAYYGCMDQFCILDNEDGGSCACSDKNAGYEARLEKIKDTLTEADRLQTEEVERVQAGANADIIFNGTRTYDKKTGDVAKNTQSAAEKRKSLLAMWDDTLGDDDDGFDSMESIADKTGDALFAAADELCRSQIDMDTCSKDVKLLKQMYSRQIVSDCKGFENSIVKKEAEAKTAMNSANAAVRSALKESLDSANKYDRGECMVEYKKCMQGADACGKDWENCVFTVAGENMQNNAAVSTAKTKVKKTVTYDITDSTMEILESKRYICERVLDQCVAVRDNVWNDFLREAAPTIKLAESKIESKKRQSCLTDISNCIQKACKDDIVGKGKDTMDACLARPDMARSFCKVEIDPCERMEPQIWAYVKDKLAAMRVDACTQEVKDCFTDENRCGENFQNCIGMDYAYIHDICPIDKLVVCKQANPKFSMTDLDSMLMGLYLNIDNSVLETCQNLVTEKMTEVCGSTTDCNKFAADEVMGTGSLRSQKDGNIYRVTGMISFGSIKMGDASGQTKDGENTLEPGEIGVSEYIAQVKSRFSNEKGASAIIPTIEEELNNIAGTINRTIEMIEQDPKIQYCITGRNLEQITGKKGEKTTARFPNLLNQVKMQIAMAALRQAQDNYNKKFTAAVAEASKNASTDIAQYMCQMIPVTGGVGIGGSTNADVELTPPYAISYDVGAGLNNSMLAKGGRGSSATGTESSLDTTAGASKFSEAVRSFTGLGGQKVKMSTGNGTREMWAIFNRETRNCHYCTSTVTKSCSSSSTSGFLGIGAKNETSCKESDPVEKCEDIQM